MTSFKTIALLFGFFFLNSLVSAHGDYACNHDSLKYETEKLQVDEDMSALGGGRLLSSYPNLRMMANYYPLENAPSAFANYVQNELIPPILSYLSNALRVKYPVNGLLKSSSSYTCDVQTPNELINGVNADYYIILDSRFEDSSVVASSRACQTAFNTNRPLTAYSNINRNQLQPANGDVLLHEKNTYVMIHELFHTLGISQNSFWDYIDDNGNVLQNHIKNLQIGGETQMVIDIPVITNKLRDYYGCSSVPGLIMENDGGDGTAGSHLERKFFVYETMASGSIYGRRVSQFSLALLEGSGWYSPNYDYAEPFFFGEGEGCNFIYQQCSNTRSFFEEFCVGDNRGCAPHGRSGGRCQSDSKTNGCSYYDPEVDHDCENDNGVDYARFPDLETYGRFSNSKCFSGTLNTRQSSNGINSFCFKFQCSGSGSNTELFVQVGSNRVTCDQEGPVTIDGYYGSINCPDPLKWCQTVGLPYCPRNCMGRGNCINNKCVCDSGFTGIDCGLYQ
jgi:leishmanolysin